MPGTFGIGIKSVQRGVVTGTTDPQTITISAVVVDKTVILMSNNFTGKHVLTNTTTITLSDYNEAGVPELSWQVVEFY